MNNETKVMIAMAEALCALLALREDTNRTYEDAYDAMFKSEGREAWNKAYEALVEFNRLT